MAAEYTQVTLDEIKKYLKRTFGSMPFKQSEDRSREIVLDMAITDNVGIRVFTSVRQNQDLARGVGEDAMRVLLWNLKKKRPLKAKTKAVAIRRTQGWRDTLRKRIGDLLDEYYDKEGEWEASASREDSSTGGPRGPTPAQLGYARSLLRQKGLAEPNLESMSGVEVSKIIDALKNNRPLPQLKGENRSFDWGGDDDEDPDYDATFGMPKDYYR